MVFSMIVIIFSLFNLTFSISISKISLDNQLVFRAFGKSEYLEGQVAMESHLMKNILLQRMSAVGEIIPPVPTARVSKNPEKSETRPDPNFSGFLRSDLRNLVSLNMESSARKFHLKDPKTDQYLIVETNSMTLTTVTSEEFDQSRQTELTWFTACNDFTAIQNSNDNSNHYFEICIAGLEEKRLFYDHTFGIFSFLSQKPTKNAIFPMQLRLVKNEETHIYEYTTMFCSKGCLRIEKDFLGIGKETLFRIEEPMFFM